MGVQIVTTAFAAEHHQRQIHFIRSTHETKIVKKAAEMGGYRQRLCNRSVHHTGLLEMGKPARAAYSFSLTKQAAPNKQC